MDILLLERGIFQSRERAARSIKAGVIHVNGKRADKAAMKVDADCEIHVSDNAEPYVSRGGIKLQKALDLFKIDLMDKIVLDVGASTGGFTHCMLMGGAKRVYAIDAGHDQLARILRDDPRVVVMEGTNIRYVTHLKGEERADFAAIDVSFISLVKVMDSVLNLLKDGGSVVSLIKPQFEAGRNRVNKKGVVRDRMVHLEVVKGVVDQWEERGAALKDLTFSPVRGPRGNIEYLAYLSKGGPGEDNRELIRDVVEKSHLLL